MNPSSLRRKSPGIYPVKTNTEKSRERHGLGIFTNRDVPHKPKAIREKPEHKTQPIFADVIYDPDDCNRRDNPIHSIVPFHLTVITPATFPSLANRFRRYVLAPCGVCSVSEDAMAIASRSKIIAVSCLGLFLNIGPVVSIVIFTFRIDVPFKSDIDCIFCRPGRDRLSFCCAADIRFRRPRIAQTDSSPVTGTIVPMT